MFLADKLNKGTGSPVDAQFNYVTMLLHGDGTNGAQNNTFVDSSTNNFTITRNGNTTQGSFSPYGSNWSTNLPATVVSGLQFDRIGTTSSFNFMHNASALWTLELWVNLSALPSSSFPIFSNNDITSSGIGVTVSINSSGQVVLFITNGTAGSPVCSNTFTTTAISTNSWTHIALVYNQSLSSGNANLYINGVASGSANKTGNSPSASNASLAAELFSYATGGTSYAFNGYASNLRITNSAVYSSAFTPSTTPLTAIANTQLLVFQSNRFVDNSTNAYAIVPRTTQSIQRYNPFGASTAYSTSVIGGSGYFDGSGDYLSVANTTALQFGTGDFTVEGWFYMTGANFANNSLFSIGSYNAGILLRYRAAGTDNFYFNNAGYDWNPSTNFRLNQWNHVAMVRSGSTVTIYVNGVSVFSVTNSTSLAQVTNTSIGTATHDLTNECCLGYISNFRMVKGTAVYTSAFTPPTSPVTAITNTSLLTNFTNGAIFDNAMMNDLETVGNAQVSTSIKKYGTGSMYFDGTGDYLYLPPSQNFAFGSGNFTIEFWGYNLTQSGNWGVFSFGATVGSDYAGITMNAGGGLFISTTGTSWSYLSIGSITLSTNDNAWHHYAIVRNGSSLLTYKDGVQQASTSISGTLVNNSGAAIIGAKSDSLSNTMTGYLDDFRVSKYARYTGSSFTPPTAAFPNTGPI